MLHNKIWRFFNGLIPIGHSVPPCLCRRMILIILPGLFFILSFHTACASSMNSANAVIADAAPVQDEITRLTAPAHAALARALMRETELKDFPVWGNVKRLGEWLDNIKALCETGDLAGAYAVAQSYKTSWYAEQAEQVAEAMPLMVLGPIDVDRFTDRKHFVLRPIPGALDKPYLGEFDIAPSNATYMLASGGRTYYRLARVFDPWQARNELIAAEKEAGLRQAWLVGDQLDFAEDSDITADEWGVYYVWTRIYSPAKRSIGIELSTAAPCIYVWINDRLNIVRRCPDEPGWDVGISTSQGGLSFIEGWNRFFIKILMRRGDAFSMRFIHHPQRPALEKYLDDLRYSLPEKLEE